jgi:hypothetical protein
MVAFEYSGVRVDNETDCQFTVNVPGPMALPPAVVIVTFPVLAPAGTVAVICVPEFTVKVVVFTPPKVTLLVPVSPVPVIVT